MAELRNIVQGTLLENELMSHHTSYGIGGPAAAYITPKDRYDLAEILKFANQHSIQTYFVGSGSNLLVADSGIDGIGRLGPIQGDNNYMFAATIELQGLEIILHIVVTLCLK